METTPQLRVVCHDIRSLHNVGATFRTADSAGFSELIISGYTGTPPDKRIAKVALDAMDLAWTHTPTIEEMLEYVADDFVVVLEQAPGSVSIHDAKLPADLDRPVTVILGSEIEGTDQRIIDRADMIVELPMRGRCESLNVSVAFGIVAYELARQVYADKTEFMRSTVEHRNKREGVLTRGVTQGQTPTH